MTRASATMSSNGWNVTGDTYRRDADGYYWYLARSDDMIVSSGYNIGAPEVENALLSHPAVAECAVIGVPCPERGQKVKAFVVLAGFAEPSDELIDEAAGASPRTQIAPYKYPREIEFVDALPKTATGKLRRSELRNARDARMTCVTLIVDRAATRVQLAEHCSPESLIDELRQIDELSVLDARAMHWMRRSRIRPRINAPTSRVDRPQLVGMMQTARCARISSECRIGEISVTLCHVTEIATSSARTSSTSARSATPTYRWKDGRWHFLARHANVVPAEAVTQTPR